jgi:hypothetical protein
MFSKKGLIIDQDGLNNAHFFNKYCIYKRKIYLTNKSKISILKLRKSQNLSSIGIIYPSSSHSFNRFDVYALNDKHTIKQEIVALHSLEKAEQTVEFLTKYLKLKLEIYSPNFRKN